MPLPESMPTARRKRGWIPLLVLALAAAGGWYWWSSSHKAAQNNPNAQAVRVSVSEVAAMDMPIDVHLVGTVFPYESVAVKARMDSQIANVHFKDGDMVREGDVLFELDDRTVRAQLAQAQANLNRDRAQLENARGLYERYSKLAEKQFASKEKLEEYKAGWQTQQAAVAATNAEIQNYQVMLGYTKITAPITGRAGTINITRGNNVRASDAQPLVTINQISPIRVQTSVSQRYYDDLQRAMATGGVPVQVTRTDSQEISVGQLEYIDNAVDTATGTFVARAAFENKDETLWPGMFVNVTIVLGVEKNALVIPQVAVQGGEESNYVFTVGPDGKAVKTPVTVVRMQDDRAVIQGLTAGQQVITDGLMKVAEGVSVTVVQPEAPKPASAQ